MISENRFLTHIFGAIKMACEAVTADELKQYEPSDEPGPSEQIVGVLEEDMQRLYVAMVQQERKVAQKKKEMDSYSLSSVFGAPYQLNEVYDIVDHVLVLGAEHVRYSNIERIMKQSFWATIAEIYNSCYVGVHFCSGWRVSVNTVMSVEFIGSYEEMFKIYLGLDAKTDLKLRGFDIRPFDPINFTMRWRGEQSEDGDWLNAFDNFIDGLDEK